MESLFFRAVLHVILKERYGFVRRYKTYQELFEGKHARCCASTEPANVCFLPDLRHK